MRKEILAGISTFFTMSYLFLVYPKMLEHAGMDFGAALTATVLITVLATIFIALFANFPSVLAPGVGVGAYIVYSIILKHEVPWQIALGMVFFVGLLVFLLSVFKIRQHILIHLPHAIRFGAVSGIGALLFLVALMNLSFLSFDEATFFQIHPIDQTVSLITFLSTLLLIILIRLNVHSAFLASILFSWILALFFQVTSYQGLFSLPHSIQASWFQLEIKKALEPKYLHFIFSLLLVTLFDSSASLSALCRVGHFFTREGKIKNLDRIVIPDGAMSAFGSFLGTGNLSFLLESSAGIQAGGRTGKTALSAAFLSLLTLFAFPLLESIPLFATTPVIGCIGLLMMKEIRAIDFRDWIELAVSFSIAVTIPLTFSIYQGIAIGFFSYTFLKCITLRYKEIHLLSWILTIVFALDFFLKERIFS